MESAGWKATVSNKRKTEMRACEIPEATRAKLIPASLSAPVCLFSVLNNMFGLA